MSDWLRSITVIAITFVGVVVVTLGLATVLVPGPGVASQPDEPGGSGAPTESATPGAHEPEPSDGIPHVGGELAFSGDHTGTLELTRDSIEGSYGLLGSNGRMTLEGQPAVITQISFDGWEFFPDPDQCSVVAGDADPQLGLAPADVACTDLVEIRDKGVASIAGTINLPADRAGPRPLPATGGTISVGDETWTFDQGFLVTWTQPAIGGQETFNMELVDVGTGARLLFAYDENSHRTTVAAVERNGELADIGGDACALTREMLGKPNPRDIAVELAISCPGVEVPGLGVVAIEGTVVVDELGYPF
jgi:hypothetical protein